MSPPRDYPLDIDIDLASPSVAAPGPDDARSGVPLTVATLFERHQASLPITEAMIADACRTLRAAESVLES